MIDDAPQTTAAELALGVLEGNERAAALRRVLAEPAFAVEVWRWRDSFAHLTTAVPEVRPSDEVLMRIERSIAPPADVAPIRRGWAWPAIATVSSMAAAVLLAVVLDTPAPVVTPTAPAVPALAAAVMPTAKGAPVSAIYYPVTGELRMTAAAFADAQHAAELWVIGGDGVPHSLGLLGPAGAHTMMVPEVHRSRLTATAVLAVSIEPLGGSPTGLPTGPVVAKGALART